MSQTLVLKFGGASVATPQSFERVAEIVAEKFKQHRRIVVVVSAMGDTTNQLISLAYQITANPPKREFDMLVTAGERISIALLAMSLAAKGLDAVSFTGSQSGIMTCPEHNQAKIIEIRPKRILDALNQGKIAIVAGFQGVSLAGEITTLGRGGSDTSAVALGVALGASYVEFYKDVEGVYTADPKKDSNAELLTRLTYDDALTIVEDGSKILHKRCLLLAKKNLLPLHVRTFQCEKPNNGTWIFEKEDQIDRPLVTYE